MKRLRTKKLERLYFLLQHSQQWERARVKPEKHRKNRIGKEKRKGIRKQKNEYKYKQTQMSRMERNRERDRLKKRTKVRKSRCENARKRKNGQMKDERMEIKT